MDPIVIVGAGHAGGRTALALREAGWRGEVVLVGNESVPPYERPALSKGMLLGESFQGELAAPEHYAESGITWIANQRAVSIDRSAGELRLDDGRRIVYHSLVLATGGRARRPPIPGADLPDVFCLRTLADARALAPRLGGGNRLLVIGGGFIGLEVAASARTLGCAVTVIEAGARLLARAVPAGLADRMAALHRERGVEIRCAVAPTAIVAAGASLEVFLDDGSAVPADAVVVGIGIVPNVELAAAAGLACDNGIVVDRRLRTEDPAIFAAGDVAAFPGPSGQRQARLESWHNAEDHARVVAANLTGGDATVCTVPWFWSDQYDHQLQVAGSVVAGPPTAVRSFGGGATIGFHLDGDGRLAGLSGFGPATAIGKEFRLARLLLERHAQLAPAQLADPAVKLKALL